MERNDSQYLQFLQILKEELRPAMGCTEPISIAYAAARARSVLGRIPERVRIEVSGNILKNAKSVVVPHTGGLRGIKAAVSAGITAGDEQAGLEVLEQSGKITGLYAVSGNIHKRLIHKGVYNGTKRTVYSDAEISFRKTQAQSVAVSDPD